MHSSERNSYVIADAERGALQVHDLIGDLRICQWSGGPCRSRCGCWFVSRLNDDRSCAISSELSNESEGVVRTEVELFGDDAALLAFWKEAIEECPSPGVRVGHVGQRETNRQERCAEFERREGRIAVAESDLPTCLSRHRRDQIPGEPEREFVLHYQSS